MKVKEPLKTLSVENPGPVVTKPVIYFVDAEFKPLVVTRNAISKVGSLTSYKNSLGFLPRAGDKIMVDSSCYVVKEVVHSLPTMRSDPQKIFIVLE